MRSRIDDVRPPLRAAASQAGTGLPELLATLVLAGLVMGVSMPAILSFYRTHQLRSAAGTVQDLIRFTRVQALKERANHRILVHDEGGSPANTLEIQVEQGGSFVTLPEHVYAIPEGVAILGDGSTDSLDSLSVGRRGECTSGRIYVQGHDEQLKVIDVEPTCFTSAT